MKFTKIRKDPAGYFFYHLRKRTMMIRTFFTSILLKISLRLKHIPYGKGLVSHGTTHFHRNPLSTIIVGDNVAFRSAFNSNLIGLNRPCMISTLNSSAYIEIGSGCGLSGVVIGAAEKIILGKNILVGANTLITDTDWHNIHPDLRRSPCTTSKPVTIGDNVWLGINTVVLKGVSIGKNTVIAANSVVVKDIPENVIAGGNPCKVIKNIEM